MEENIVVLVRRFNALLTYATSRIADLETRLTKLERECDSWQEAVVDSLCEFADRVAPLEACVHGKRQT